MRDLRRQEKQWEMMRQHLSAESQGKEPRTFASTRTLFGIRSTVEQQLDEFVAREESRRARERERVRGGENLAPCAGGSLEGGDDGDRADSPHQD